jgi:hypothetical protein
LFENTPKKSDVGKNELPKANPNKAKWQKAKISTSGAASFRASGRPISPPYHTFSHPRAIKTKIIANINTDEIKISSLVEF